MPEPTVTVSAKPLRRILEALTGADHFIRELQNETNLHQKGLVEEDPISQLVKEFNEQINS